jgi:carbonic anhydrase
MANKDVLKLLAGFRRFRERYFLQPNSLYSKLSVRGQSPKTLVIGCSDSRVDPAIITSADPGDLFVVRNVANLVPPFETSVGFHGVSSAIEFAVVNLKVENVIVLGHRQCGGIRALIMDDGSSRQKGFVQSWMQIAVDARERVMKRAETEPMDEEALCRCGEMEAIKTSIRNLRTFPFVVDAVKERGMNLLGIYFDLENGDICEWNESVDKFETIDLKEWHGDAVPR